jgi:hypothetical protein
MGAAMDLIAGDAREILLALTVEDYEAFADRTRFDAHLALGGGLDPTWLDLFAEAVRTVTDDAEPRDFLDARRELDGPSGTGERTVERVDPLWTGAIARLPDALLGSVAGAWIDLVDEELGPLASEEKPWIRSLAGEIVRFCRAADRSPDVLFAWSL